MAKRHCPGALLAALAASLAGLLLAEAAWGQTFTYSRGWKPGGKRSPQGVPLGPPLGSELAPIAGYVDDLAVEEQQPPPARPAARPPVVYLATVGERWVSPRADRRVRRIRAPKAYTAHGWRGMRELCHHVGDRCLSPRRPKIRFFCTHSSGIQTSLQCFSFFQQIAWLYFNASITEIVR